MHSSHRLFRCTRHFYLLSSFNQCSSTDAAGLGFWGSESEHGAPIRGGGAGKPSWSLGLWVKPPRVGGGGEDSGPRHVWAQSTCSLRGRVKDHLPKPGILSLAQEGVLWAPARVTGGLAGFQGGAAARPTKPSGVLIAGPPSEQADQRPLITEGPGVTAVGRGSSRSRREVSILEGKRFLELLRPSRSEAAAKDAPAVSVMDSSRCWSARCRETESSRVGSNGETDGPASPADFAAPSASFSFAGSSQPGAVFAVACPRGGAWSPSSHPMSCEGQAVGTGEAASSAGQGPAAWDVGVSPSPSPP